MKFKKGDKVRLVREKVEATREAEDKFEFVPKMENFFDRDVTVCSTWCESCNCEAIFLVEDNIHAFGLKYAFEPEWFELAE